MEIIYSTCYKILNAMLSELEEIMLYYQVVTTSSYQPLYTCNGNSHPQLGKIYVHPHELLASIFKMRGQANYYEIDSDEYESVDNSEIMEKIASQGPDSSQTLECFTELRFQISIPNSTTTSNLFE
ncbi:hypothetical protein HDV02_003726 [Globomyces sp. JEL0801]|nr:hypothetical protein HDV02_003726 [Globomyces sp. JEL0801]